MLYHIRPVNIFLALVAELTIYLTLLLPTPVAQTLVSWHQLFAFLGFSIGMMVAGYLINDLYDESIDRANQKNTPLVKGQITRRQLWLGFIFGEFLTLAAWIYLWRSYDYHSLIWLLWLGPLGLLFYAIRLKCSPLAGNVLMALFAACLPAMFMVRLPELPWQTGFPDSIRFVYLWYLFFSFGATWFREIVKDLEDEPGDRKGKCQTFPVRYGLTNGHRYALTIGIIYGFGLVTFVAFLFEQVKLITWLSTTVVVLPTLILAWWLTYHRKYHLAQQWIKMHFAAGLLMLWIFKWMEVWNG